MKKLVVLFVVVISACSVKLAPLTQANADKAAAKYPAITLSELNKGKETFESKCTMCHGLKNPGKKTATKWDATVTQMVNRANKKTEKISANDRDLIMKYLVSMSKGN